MIVSACFYADDGMYPNIKAASIKQRQYLYWRCMAGMFETALRFGGAVDRVMLFTNADPPEDIAAIFDRQKVRCESVPYDTRLPSEVKLFSGSLYTIDAIRWCARSLADDEKILFLDPDCIVTDDLSNVADAIDRSGLVAYNLRIPRSSVSNGLSRGSIAEICRELLSIPPKTCPDWLGGELIGLNGATARLLAPVLEKVWPENLARLKAGKTGFLTEEQLLSGVVASEQLTYFDAGDGLVKRIWTGRRYRNHTPFDLDNIVWHLPSEKARGFQRLYRIIGADSPLWYADTELRKRLLARIFGLRGDSARELVYIARRAATEAMRAVRGREQRFSVGI